MAIINLNRNLTLLDYNLQADSYQGSWDANANVPVIPPATIDNQGWYWIVAVAGSTNIDGITSWAVGDKVMSNGTIWQKIPFPVDTDAFVPATRKVNGYALTSDISLVPSDLGLTNPVTGTGAAGQIAVFSGTSAIEGNANLTYSSDMLTLLHTDAFTSGLRIGSNLTNASNQAARVKLRHYTLTEEPVTILLARSQVGISTLQWGGGSAAENAVTKHQFYTAANVTTVSGTENFVISHTETYTNVKLGAKLATGVGLQVSSTQLATTLSNGALYCQGGVSSANYYSQYGTLSYYYLDGSSEVTANYATMRFDPYGSRGTHTYVDDPGGESETAYTVNVVHDMRAWDFAGDFSLVIGRKAILDPAVNTAKNNILIGRTAGGDGTQPNLYNCIAVGNALTLNTQGSGTLACYDTVALGWDSFTTGYLGLSNSGSTTLRSSLGLGNYSGKYETGGYKLFIDTIDRGTEALGRTNSLVYGIFDAVPANQEFHINGKVYCSTLTTNGIPVVAANGQLTYVSDLTYSSSILNIGKIEIGADGNISGAPTTDTRVWGWSRRVTVGAVGRTLTLRAGGCYVGGTDLAGGTLNLSGGISSGAASSTVNLQTCTADGTGVADNTPTTKFSIVGSVVTSHETLNLRASTTSAGTSPMKIPTGVLMTAPEAGAVEYDGSYFYGTDSAASRKSFRRNDTNYGGFYAYDKAIVIPVNTAGVYHAVRQISANDITTGLLEGFTVNVGRSVDTNISREDNGTGGKLQITLSAAPTPAIATGDIFCISNANTAAHNGVTKITRVSDTVFTCDNINYSTGAGNSAALIDEPAYILVGAKAAGNYYCSAMVDFTATAGKDMKFEVNVGTTPWDNIAMQRVTTGNYDGISASGHITIAVGDRIFLTVKNSTDTVDPTIKNLNLNLHRL